MMRRPWSPIRYTACLALLSACGETPSATDPQLGTGGAAGQTMGSGGAAVDGAGGTTSTGGANASGGRAVAEGVGGTPEPQGPPPAGESWHGWACPTGPYEALPFETGTVPQPVAGVPLDDGFITGNLVILEGPAWWNGELYFSEIDGAPRAPGSGGMCAGGGASGADGGGPGAGGEGPGAGGEGAGGSNPGVGGAGAGGAGSGGTGAGGDGSGDGGSFNGAGGRTMNADPPPGRLLKLTASGEVEIVAPEIGSNGLAVDPDGALTICSHESGSVVSMETSGGDLLDRAVGYLDLRFNSPNDLAFGREGSLYFTDPDYQAPWPVPQEATRVYRMPPDASEVVAVVEDLRQPNGIALSPDGRVLYLSSQEGVFALPVASDGTLGARASFASEVARQSDGMGIDCAGNVYLTVGREVIVVDPSGSELARLSFTGISSVTNVAFGGPDHKTLFITALGSGRGATAGLFTVASAIPGFPY